MAKEMLGPGIPSPQKLANDIGSIGYVIYHNAISVGVIDELRLFWLDYFTSVPKKEVVRSGMQLGEKNFNSYSNTNFWCLYRDFDFLWNKPTHALTRELQLAIHVLRNRAQGDDDDYGLLYNEQKYSIYGSTSCYPANIGFLNGHVDGHKKDDKPILHFMVPITFRKIDYEAGGLEIADKNADWIDIDSKVSPGSLIFFDGRFEHRVQKIIPLPGKNIGRIATFAIPMFFKSQEDIPKPILQTSKLYTKVKERLGKTFSLGQSLEHIRKL